MIAPSMTFKVLLKRLLRNVIAVRACNLMNRDDEAREMVLNHTDSLIGFDLKVLLF